MNSIAAAALSAVDTTLSASIGSRSGLDLTDVPPWTRREALSGPVLPVAPLHGFAAQFGVAVSVALSCTRHLRRLTTALRSFLRTR